MTVHLEIFITATHYANTVTQPLDTTAQLDVDYLYLTLSSSMQAIHHFLSIAIS